MSVQALYHYLDGGFILVSLKRLLYIWIFMISAILLAVRFVHTKCYNDILTDDFVPDEKYTDYLEHNRMEDVDLEKLDRLCKGYQ